MAGGKKPFPKSTGKSGNREKSTGDWDGREGGGCAFECPVSARGRFLIGLRMFGGQAAELGEEPRGNADGKQLFGITGDGPAHAARAAQLLVRGFRNIGKIQPAIRHMPDALYALPGAR